MVIWANEELIPADGQPTGVPKQYPISKKKKFQDEDNTINLSGDDEEGDDTELKPVKPNQKQTSMASDPCTLLQTKRGWFVQDNSFDDQQSAISRTSELTARGIPCRWASQTCIAQDRLGWLVWLGELYPTEAAAQTAADNYALAYQRYGLKNGRLLVRKLR